LVGLEVAYFGPNAVPDVVSVDVDDAAADAATNGDAFLARDAVFDVVSVAVVAVVVFDDAFDDNPFDNACCSSSTRFGLRDGYLEDIIRYQASAIREEIGRLRCLLLVG